VPYKSVVVGTDGSETAELAVRHAARVAAAAKARLVVVTAYEPHGDVEAKQTLDAPEDLRWRLTDRNQAETKARHGRELASGEGATGVVVQAVAGQPAEVLLESAKDFNADLIVVGSKGLTSAARFVLGSVASSVGHHAPCDVLIVHTTG
jgi:nucleotide-binding universal stress UspA family protein